MAMKSKSADSTDSDSTLDENNAQSVQIRYGSEIQCERLALVAAPFSPTENQKEKQYSKIAA